MSVLEGKPNEAVDRVKAVSLDHIFVSFRCFGVPFFLPCRDCYRFVAGRSVGCALRSFGFLPSSTIDCDCHSCVPSCILIADIPLPAVL